jgi:hypothetical protein
MTLELAIAEREALVSALVRLKFNEDEVPEPYFGSPLVGEALLKIVSSVIAESAESSDLGRARRWRTWQDWSAREHERQIVVNYVASLPTWEDWSAERQRNFLRHCAAPFPLTDGDLQGLSAQIEVARAEPTPR